MSHLKHVVDYISFLGDQGVTCNAKQTTAVQEAFIRALVMYNCKINNTFHFSTVTEETIWEQMDTWNSVFPINARFIFESARSRLATLHKELSNSGVVSPASTYELVFDVETHDTEGQVVHAKFVATDNELFSVLLNYLYKEVVAHHE